MWKDPIVTEVRENRKRLEEGCGNSIHQIYEKAVEVQRQFKGEIIVAKGKKRLEFPAAD
jgi:hypothetical protein